MATGWETSQVKGPKAVATVYASVTPQSAIMQGFWLKGFTSSVFKGVPPPMGWFAASGADRRGHVVDEAPCEQPRTTTTTSFATIVLFD